MVDTVTQNYGWTKPAVGGDQATWGGLLNDDLDLIDAQVFDNQTAIANGATVIGQIAMFAGETPPTNWLLCNGAVYTITAIPKLAPILNNRFPGGDGVSTMAVPNLNGSAPVGYDGVTWLMGASGGEQNHTLAIAEMPSHNHAISDPGHYHGFYDPGHNHGLNQTPHGHGVNDPTHSHGGVYTSYTGGGVFAPQSGGWNLNLGNTQGAGTGVSVQAQNANVSLNPAVTGAGIEAAATGISEQYSGGGGAHNNMQPYTVVGFIIRYQ